VFAERRDDVVEITVQTAEPEGSRAPGSPVAQHPEVRLELQIPRGMGVRVGTTSGRISVTGTTGEVALTTASGDVALNSPSGTVTAETASGDVTLRIAPDARMRIEARSTSGEVTARAPLRIEEMSRSRLVGVLNAPDRTVSIRTVSGDIRIDCPEA